MVRTEKQQPRIRRMVSRSPGRCFCLFRCRAAGAYVVTETCCNKSRFRGVLAIRLPLGAAPIRDRVGVSAEDMLLQIGRTVRGLIAEAAADRLPCTACPVRKGNGCMFHAFSYGSMSRRTAALMLSAGVSSDTGWISGVWRLADGSNETLERSSPGNASSNRSVG
jgi:hypothetical protein